MVLIYYSWENPQFDIKSDFMSPRQFLINFGHQTKLDSQNLNHYISPPNIVTKLFLEGFNRSN